MRVLVACEFSGVVRDAFLKAGHDAVSCDLLPTESPGPHIQDDVMKHLDDGWDMMIAHPPCTYLCNSGVSWLHKQPDRWFAMGLARQFFDTLLNAKIPRICVENPVPHGHAKLPKYTQTIQPYQFGEDASKRTCLWLRGLPRLRPTRIIKKDRYANQTPSGRNNIPPSADRWKERSRFYRGIADAMAEQWGGGGA